MQTFDGTFKEFAAHDGKPVLVVSCDDGTSRRFMVTFATEHAFIRKMVGKTEKRKWNTGDTFPYLHRTPHPRLRISCYPAAPTVIDDLFVADRIEVVEKSRDL